MEREILFRGKRLDNGEWVYGVPLFDWADCSCKCQDQHNGELFTFFGWSDEFHEYDEFEVDPVTVGQYTGLTDKNGTKIFEGDVICGKSWRASREDRFEVRWRSAFCAFTALNAGAWRPDMSRNDMLDYSVIGNIHDTPELLQEVQP